MADAYTGITLRSYIAVQKDNGIVLLHSGVHISILLGLFNSESASVTGTVTERFHSNPSRARIEATGNLRRPACLCAMVLSIVTPVSVLCFRECCGCFLRRPIARFRPAEQARHARQRLIAPLGNLIRMQPMRGCHLAECLIFTQHFAYHFGFEFRVVVFSHSVSRSTDNHAILLSDLWGTLHISTT